MKNNYVNLRAVRFLWVALMYIVMNNDGYATVMPTNDNNYFSTISQQTTVDTPGFLQKSKVEIDSYFNRVIDYENDRVIFRRSSSRIITDLSDIVNYYLNVYCSSLEIQFGGFSPNINDQILDLDKTINTSITTTAIEDVETRLNILQSDINQELNDFIMVFQEEAQNNSSTNKKGYLPLDPIEAPILYELEVKNTSPLDPKTGSPILINENEEFGERIIQLLESNNRLIEILSTQLITLNQEMITLKKEGLEYQREFSDIHQRIDGLENAINEIRSSNINISSNPKLEPVTLNSVTVLFDKNSIEIGSEYILSLNDVFGKLISNKKLRAIITGYADKSGSVELNNKISRLRAHAITEYLINKGVPKNQLLLNYLGDTKSRSETKFDRKVVIEMLSE